MLLQWFPALIKYVEYQAAFARVCQCLQLLVKGNQEKIKRFIAVAEESHGYLDLGLFMNAILN